jgi:predicted nucleotidyltransferase
MAALKAHRQQLLVGLRRFVVSVRQMAGVRRIAILGSIVTAKQDPTDVDVLVVVADDADLAPLATASRRLCRGTPRVSIGVLTCFSPTSGTRTSAEHVGGRGAGRACGRRRTRSQRSARLIRSR